MVLQNQEKGVCIRLKTPWMGTPAGSKMHVWEHVAKELFKRGACEILDDKFDAKKEDEIVVEEIKQEIKEVKEPAKNKMVKAPNKSKGFI